MAVYKAEKAERQQDKRLLETTRRFKEILQNTENEMTRDTVVVTCFSDQSEGCSVLTSHFAFWNHLSLLRTSTEVIPKKYVVLSTTFV